MVPAPTPAPTVPRSSPRRTVDRSGPPLLVPAVVLAALTVAGAVLGAAGPRPDTAAVDVPGVLARSATTADVAAFLLLGSAFPVVVYAATAVRRLRRLGVTVPGPLMGLAGAVLAAGSLVLSALVGWTATRTATLGDPALSRALVTLWFAAGGIGFVAPLGLLLLGLGVPSLRLRLVPRPLAWSVVVVGVLAVASPLGLLTDAAFPLIPVGRFGGLLVLVGLALALPTSGAAGAAGGPVGAAEH